MLQDNLWRQFVSEQNWKTDKLDLVFSFEVFFSTFVKMADFQVIKNSSDISLFDSNCPLLRSSKPSTMLSLFSFQFIVFGSLLLRPILIILWRFLFLIIRKSTLRMYPWWWFKISTVTRNYTRSISPGIISVNAIFDTRS